MDYSVSKEVTKGTIFDELEVGGLNCLRNTDLGG